MIYIALGANLPSRFGAPPQTLAAARAALEERDVKILKKSRLWLTAPVPASDQPWFHNQVVAVAAQSTPHQLLEILHEIEESFGRTRQARNEARLLDLDIVAWHDDIIDEPGLAVPHSRMHERLFVLGPLSDIAPGWVHPASGQSLMQLLAALPADQKAEVIDG